MKQSFKIKVRFISRAQSASLAQKGEDVSDQTIQVWGADLWSAANEWGIRTSETRPVYGIYAMDGRILFFNGGDHPIG